MAKEILIVEDDRRLADLCARALEGEGYDVLQAHDGAAAMDMVERMPPALILLDLLVPKRDGRALMAELGRSTATSSIPVIAMSGVFKGKGTERELLDAGAKAFLDKPFDVSELSRLVKQIVGPAETAAQVESWERAQLEDVSAAEFLWRLMEKEASGAVHFVRGKLEKILLLERGCPTAVRSNATAETLGRFLLSRKQLDEVSFQAMNKLTQRGVRSGEALLQLKIMTSEQLLSTLRAQAAAKALELFSWTAGEAWIQEGVHEVSHASPLEGWSSTRLVLRGVKYVPFERTMTILTPFADFGVSLTGKAIEGPDAKLPAIRSLVTVLRRPARVGQLLADHAAAVYGLWLIGAVNFTLPGTGDPATMSGTSLSAIHVQESGRGAELRDAFHRMRGQDYFQLLGIGRDDDEAKVQAAYLQLAKRFHPDRFANEAVAIKTLVSEIFGLISSARDTLLDSARRADYVLELGGGTSAPKRVNQVLEAEKLCREGEALLKKREYAQALAKFERACELDSEEGELQVLSGWTYFVVNRKMGDGEKTGQARIERGIALAPESTTGYYYMAQLHKACGRPGPAQKLFKKVLDLDPGHVEAGQALRVLRMRASKDEKKGATGGLFGFGRKKS